MTLGEKTRATVDLEPIGETEWRDAWWSSEGATFFQSPMWAQAWRRYLGGRARTRAWRATFGDGRWAVVPTFEVRSLGGLLRRYLLSPGGTYGGPFAERALDADVVLELMRRLRSRTTAGAWRWSPYAARGSCPDGPGVVADHTRVLELAGGMAVLERRWSKGHRAAVRQAERLGVKVELASRDQQWREYDELYRQSLLRWGDRATSRYGSALFEALRDGSGQQARLWLAYAGQDIAAGALCLYSRRHVAYWHGAACERLLACRPVHLLMSAALQDACDRGTRWFDFNPSGGHAGVEAFKKGWGAESLAAPMIRWELPDFLRMRGIRRLVRPVRV
jgi:CelD/BcsL family acetyltransferase involved in cellulose biosynthesis